jgi:choline dehydrogenase-like flavoprotein
MFVDARSVPDKTVVEYDICIIGAGAAGITLAREFNGQKFLVCLLESGGLEFDPVTQSLYQGTNTGPFKIELDVERMRYFGGTTNLWGGFCRPFDDQDFKVRDWVPNSGWPFGRTELAPYYERAHALCKLGPFNYDIDAWNSNDKNCSISLNNGRLVTKLLQLIPTQPDNLLRFGRSYRDDVRSSTNITTYLYANVTNILQSINGKEATNVIIQTISGNKWSISARIFILATGAIENARLLLLSNKTEIAGIGNDFDLVGRYFMAHLQLPEVGIFLPSPGTSMQHFQGTDDGALSVSFRCRAKTINWGGDIVPLLTLSGELQQQYKLVNFASYLEVFSTSSSFGLESFHDLASTTHFGRILADSENGAAIRGKKQGDMNLVQAYKLRNVSETVPNSNSRVTLSSEMDQFNCNRVVLNWMLSPIDTDSLQLGYKVIGQELGRFGLGRLKISIPTEFGSSISNPSGDFWSQHHHMGTTRMHEDPKKGVVNANCRVHGVSNLFIAGSSVFPTSSSATPTLTIIALAVRLADHIKGELR